MSRACNSPHACRTNAAGTKKAEHTIYYRKSAYERSTADG